MDLQDCQVTTQTFEDEERPSVVRDNVRKIQTAWLKINEWSACDLRQNKNNI